MGKTVAAIAGGVAVGIVVAFANAGAFQFPWGSDAAQQGAPDAPAAQTAQTHQPAPANAPEPYEARQGSIAMPSWAPMVKKVMPTVVNVAITQEVKTGAPGEGDEEGPGGGQDQPGPGPGGGGGSPFGPGNPFGGGGGPG